MEDLHYVLTFIMSNIFIIPSVYVGSKITYAAVNLALVFTTLPHLLVRYKWKIVDTIFLNTHIVYTHTHIVLSQPCNIVTREDFFVYFKKPPFWYLHFLSRDMIDAKQPIRFYLKNNFIFIHALNRNIIFSTRKLHIRAEWFDIIWCKIII